MFSVFLAWRFYGSTLYQNDDLSHWALVARHLLRYNAFPDQNAAHVFFQSYPLGAAAFIYYICRTTANTEGMYLIAQNLLFGLFYLPAFAHIHASRRRIGAPIALAVFLFLFNYARSMIDLRVDLLLAFLAFGTSASIIYYRRDPKKALICALPGIMAVVFLKSSGIFFAVIEIILLVCIARLRGCSRRTALLMGFAATCGMLLAWLGWMLHIRFSFTAALDTKHAISLSAWAAEAASKNSEVLLAITRGFLKKLLAFSSAQRLACIFILGCIFLLAYKHFAAKNKQSGALLLCTLIVPAVIYAIWLLMLYLMYIFSMPELEATALAGFSRYNSTGLAYSMGLAAIALFISIGEKHSPALLPVRLLQAGSAILCCIAALALGLPESITGLHLERSEAYVPERAVLMQARKDFSLPDGGHYAFFCFDEDLSVGPYHEYYRIKYEFETADIIMLAENPENPGVFLAGTRENNHITESLQDDLTTIFDTCDALLVLDPSETFEAQLNRCLDSRSAGIPVLYAYTSTAPESL